MLFSSPWTLYGAATPSLGHCLEARQSAIEQKQKPSKKQALTLTEMTKEKAQVCQSVCHPFNPGPPPPRGLLGRAKKRYAGITTRCIVEQETLDKQYALGLCRCYDVKEQYTLEHSETSQCVDARSECLWAYCMPLGTGSVANQDSTGKQRIYGILEPVQESCPFPAPDLHKNGTSTKTPDFYHLCLYADTLRSAICFTSLRAKL